MVRRAATGDDRPRDRGPHPARTQPGRRHPRGDAGGGAHAGGACARFRAELRAFLGPAEVSRPGELPELSDRELEVLALVANGLSNEEIAARLYLSVRTVERHLSNIYAKLRVSGKAARAAAAARFSRSH